MIAEHVHRSFPFFARVGRQSGRAAYNDLHGEGTIAAVDANGLPNLDPSGLLLPDFIA